MRFPRTVKEEVASVYFLLVFSIFFYYSGLEIPGVILLTLTSLFWANVVQRKKSGMRWKEFRFEKKNLSRDAILGTAAGAGFLVLFNIYRILVGFPTITPGFGGNFYLLGAIFGVAFGEEFFFRAYLQNRLRKLMGEWPRVFLVGLMLTGYKYAIFFNSINSFYSIMDPLVFSFIGSIVMSILLEKTGRMTAPFFGHLSWDILAYSYLLEIPYWVI
jgi:membrane protease YdiL (CAAX protease family)